jgi:hypothetical protein
MEISDGFSPSWYVPYYIERILWSFDGIALSWLILSDYAIVVKSTGAVIKLPHLYCLCCSLQGYTEDLKKIKEDHGQSFWASNQVKLQV